MIVINQDRELNVGDTILVYRNLHKANQFSIKNKRTGLVVAHANNFLINNVTFRLSEKSRIKVVENKVRSVHAWCKASYQDECEMDTSNLDELYYNPYYTDCFINRRTGERLDFVSKVYVDDKGKCWIVEM